MVALMLNNRRFSRQQNHNSWRVFGFVSVMRRLAEAGAGDQLGEISLPTLYEVETVASRGSMPDIVHRTAASRLSFSSSLSQLKLLAAGLRYFAMRGYNVSAVRVVAARECPPGRDVSTSLDFDCDDHRIRISPQADESTCCDLGYIVQAGHPLVWFNLFPGETFFADAPTHGYQYRSLSSRGFVARWVWAPSLAAAISELDALGPSSPSHCHATRDLN